jgi:hypothetical protein
MMNNLYNNTEPNKTLRLLGSSGGVDLFGPHLSHEVTILSGDTPWNVFDAHDVGCSENPIRHVFGFATR